MQTLSQMAARLVAIMLSTSSSPNSQGSIPLGEKNYEDKLRKALVAEFNRAQEERGRDTCGKTAVNQWLKEHQPKVALHPSMTDYCDTCKFLKEKLSRNQIVQNRLQKSGNASVAELHRLQREKEEYEREHKEHKENAKKSHEYYREAAPMLASQWSYPVVA